MRASGPATALPVSRSVRTCPATRRLRIGAPASQRAAFDPYGPQRVARRSVSQSHSGQAPRPGCCPHPPPLLESLSPWPVETGKRSEPLEPRRARQSHGQSQGKAGGPRTRALRQKPMQSPLRRRHDNRRPFPCTAPTRPRRLGRPFPAPANATANPSQPRARLRPRYREASATGFQGPSPQGNQQALGGLVNVSESAPSRKSPPAPSAKRTPTSGPGFSS